MRGSISIQLTWQVSGNLDYYVSDSNKSDQNVVPVEVGVMVEGAWTARQQCRSIASVHQNTNAVRFDGGRRSEQRFTSGGWLVLVEVVLVEVVLVEVVLVEAVLVEMVFVPPLASPLPPRPVRTCSSMEGDTGRRPVPRYERYTSARSPPATGGPRAPPLPRDASTSVAIASSHCRSPRFFLLTPPCPSLSPSGFESILPSPLEERKRPGFLSLLLRRKGGGGELSPPLLCVVTVTFLLVPLVFLLLPFLLPLLPLPPLSRWVYCCVARQVECCIVTFRSSPCAPSALIPLFRCDVGQSSAGSLVFLLQEVDCCVMMCDSIP